MKKHRLVPTIPEDAELEETDVSGPNFEDEPMLELGVEMESLLSRRRRSEVLSVTIPEYGYYSSSSKRTSARERRIAICVTASVVLFSFVGGTVLVTHFWSKAHANCEISRFLPPDLWNGGVYKMEDMVNERGVSPPYWNLVQDAAQHHFFDPTDGNSQDDMLGSPDDDYFSNDNGNVTKEVGHISPISWGPCYPPPVSSKPYNWTRAINRHKRKAQNKHVVYPPMKYHSAPHQKGYDRKSEPPAGYCRPGFIIIGAGKCGTSSLYHYLVGHDRVLPAVQKQIHYFKNHPRLPMEWYLSYFPTTNSFLSSGALMTGEASPGYLPYPDVALRTARRMTTPDGSGPKIICIGREPLDRSWSSYNYNYVQPALQTMRKGGGGHNIPSRKSDDYYREHHLFSFEELIRAELAALRECLKPGGQSEMGARDDWAVGTSYTPEYARREKEGLPPLVDFEKHCYGDRVSSTVPRKQWTDLVEANPNKFINLSNLFLVQGIIGRSLYTLPLEWWYAAFDPKDVYFFCTNDMRDRPVEAMDDVRQFLGLPYFNFTDVVSQGMYNVGGHQGYDKVISWEKAEHETEHVHSTDEIPISRQMRKEFLDFVKPFNERLFQQTGRRCSGW
mmetsp:Transcript_11718/g.21316  ORF Transcript_11718/g.21316 Transcript_11718/m.21316 type:complete len:616 (-) Transcript_11718:150-1997(-)